MLKALMSVKLSQLKSWLNGPVRVGKKRSKAMPVLFALLMLYSLAALGLLFWQTLSTLADTFIPLGLGWLYFTMTALFSFSLMFVGSVFLAKSQLYEAKDSELLLSMPIKPSAILLSRLAMLLIVEIVFALPAVIPGILIWCTRAGAELGTIAAYIVVLLLLPLLALAVAALFGWILSVVTARVKNKALFATVLSVAFMAVYFYFMSRLNNVILGFAAHAQDIAGSLGAVTPLYWLGSAISDTRIDYLLYIVAIIMAAVLLTYTLLSATFLKTNTTKHGFAKNKYVERRAELSTPAQALLRRERARFTSSSVYMVNCGLGLLMQLVCAGALIVKGNDILSLASQVPQLVSILPPALTMALCLMVSMDYITAPSVSLEGKSLWIVQSLPVEPFQALMAKLKLHLYICLPVSLVASGVCIAVVKPSAAYALAMVLTPAVFCVFVGLLGLAEDLRHARLDWTSEAQAVKSGFGLLFTMLISWAAIALPVLAYILLGTKISPSVMLLGFTLITFGADLLMFGWLRRKGAAMFSDL